MLVGVRRAWRKPWLSPQTRLFHGFVNVTSNSLEGRRQQVTGNRLLVADNSPQTCDGEVQVPKVPGPRTIMMVVAVAALTGVIPDGSSSSMGRLCSGSGRPARTVMSQPQQAPLERRRRLPPSHRHTGTARRAQRVTPPPAGPPGAVRVMLRTGRHHWPGRPRLPAPEAARVSLND